MGPQSKMGPILSRLDVSTEQARIVRLLVQATTSGGPPNARSRSYRRHHQGPLRRPQARWTQELPRNAEKINPSYVSRVLRSTLMAPAIVDAVLNGNYSPALTLSALMKRFPIEWEDQQPFFLNS